MDWATCLRIVVFPAFGGETMRPRWPLPIGATRSTTRGARSFGFHSRRRRSIGYSGVRSSKSVLALALIPATVPALLRLSVGALVAAPLLLPALLDFFRGRNGRVGLPEGVRARLGDLRCHDRSSAVAVGAGIGGNGGGSGLTAVGGRLRCLLADGLFGSGLVDQLGQLRLAVLA